MLIKYFIIVYQLMIYMIFYLEQLFCSILIDIYLEFLWENREELFRVSLLINGIKH